jgi:hypothetical protein
MAAWVQANEISLYDCDVYSTDQLANVVADILNGDSFIGEANSKSTVSQKFTDVRAGGNSSAMIATSRSGPISELMSASGGLSRKQRYTLGVGCQDTMRYHCKLC